MQKISILIEQLEKPDSWRVTDHGWNKTVYNVSVNGQLLWTNTHDSWQDALSYALEHIGD